MTDLEFAELNASDACRVHQEMKEAALVNESQNLSAQAIEFPRPAPSRLEYRTEAPIYLVLTNAGSLAGYTRPELLKCDLAINQRLGDPAVQVFKIQKGWTIQYAPISAEEIPS